MEKLKNIQLLISVFFIVLFLFGCSTVKKDWKLASDVNTLNGYQNFLQKHQKSEYEFAAKKRIEDLVWENLKQKDAISAYKNYINSYGIQGKYYLEAFQYVEKAEWEITVQANTVAAYEEFINSFGGESAYHAEAALFIEKSEWNKVKQLNTIASYKQYIEKYAYEGHYISDAIYEAFKYQGITSIKFDISVTNQEDFREKDIQKYAEDKFYNILNELSLYSSKNDFILNVRMKIGYADWYTSLNGQPVSTGIYINTEFILHSNTGKVVKILEISDGWEGVSSNQQKCLHNSIDLHIFSFLSDLAELGIKSKEISNYLFFIGLPDLLPDNFSKYSPAGKGTKKILHEIGKIGKDAIPSLIHGLKQEDRINVALFALGETRSPEALEPLIDFMENGPSWSWSGHEVVKALAKIGDRRAVAPLISQMKKNSKHSLNNRDIIFALGEIGDNRAVPHLIEVASDDYLASIWALSEIGGDKVVTHLISLLRVKQADFLAARALGNLGDSRAVGPLINSLNSANNYLRKSSSEALGKLADIRAIAALEKILNDEDAELKAVASEALKKIRDKNL